MYPDLLGLCATVIIGINLLGPPILGTRCGILEHNFRLIPVENLLQLCREFRHLEDAVPAASKRKRQAPVLYKDQHRGQLTSPCSAIKQSRHVGDAPAAEFLVLETAYSAGSFTRKTFAIRCK